MRLSTASVEDPLVHDGSKSIGELNKRNVQRRIIHAVFMELGPEHAFDIKPKGRTGKLEAAVKAVKARSLGLMSVRQIRRWYMHVLFTVYLTPKYN